MIDIWGYDLLGPDKKEGIRYAWQDDRFRNYVESAAFVNRTKLGGEEVCAYTTSVSSGCLLKAMGCPCRFCRTGKVLPFGGLLTYQEIAKQNIFMVLSDMNCTDMPSLADRPREFAYMGQGEPGLSYSQVRLAIELTNKVMKELGQNVFRHIFATSGIPEAIAAYKDDVKHFFTERVTLHYSLHATGKRVILMPINKLYPYREVIHQMNEVFDITHEKVCISIMLFWNFKAKGSDIDYSTTIENIMPIMNLLDPEKYRLSFCEYNPSEDVGTSDVYPQDEAERLLSEVKTRGFEAKLFSSFGQKELTACGLLGGKTPEKTASEKWRELENYALELINKHINY